MRSRFPKGSHKREGPVSRPLIKSQLVLNRPGLLLQHYNPFLDPCFPFKTLFGKGFLNGRDLVLVKRIHRPVKGLVGQIIGVVVLPKVYLSGQQEPEQSIESLLFEVLFELVQEFLIGQFMVIPKEFFKMLPLIVKSNIVLEQ